MLICILGPPQSGKSSLAEHLVAQHDFTRVHLGSASLPAGAPADALAFASSSEFLDFVTQTWRKNYVTTDIKGRLKLVEFAKRPFVAVVSVQAPLGVRFARAVATAKLKGLEDPSLDEFVAADDAILYGITPTLAPPATSPEPPSTPKKTQSSLKANEPPSPAPSPSRLSLALPTTPLSDPPEPLLPLLRELSNISLLNPHSTFEPFFSTLSLPTINDSLRPPWDAYFMRLASLASLRSNCMKRRVGCVLVRERRVVSTGYNGTPRGVRNCSEGGCSRCNSHGDGFGTATGSAEGGTGTSMQMAMGVGLDECLCLHAEENALLEVGRERVSGGGTPGAVLYCNTCPCLRCAIRIVQCGVSEVVYSLAYATDAASRRVLEEGKVSIRQIPLPAFDVL